MYGSGFRKRDFLTRDVYGLRYVRLKKKVVVWVADAGGFAAYAEGVASSRVRLRGRREDISLGVGVGALCESGCNWIE